MSLQAKITTFIGTLKTDFPAALGMMSEDITWINRLPEHIPFNGEFHGHEGIARYFQLLAENFELGNYDLDSFDFIETDDTLVIVGCEAGGKVIPTGKVFDLDFVWVVRFDSEGRISYLREHNDTAAIGAAFTA